MEGGANFNPRTTRGVFFGGATETEASSFLPRTTVGGCEGLDRANVAD